MRTISSIDSPRPPTVSRANSRLATTLGPRNGRPAQQDWRRPGPAEPDPDGDRWQAGIVPYVQQLMSSGNHPWFARMVTEADDDPDPTSRFEWQLDRVLDGLATALRRPF